MQRESFPGESFSTSAQRLSYLLLLVGPLWLHSTLGGGWPCPYSSNRQVQPELSTEPSKLTLSAYTLALITSIHMALLKNLGTVLGQIKFTRHSRVAPCLWGDEVTVLQACEGCGTKGGEQQTLSDLHRICVLMLRIFPLLSPAGRYKRKYELSSIGCTI